MFQTFVKGEPEKKQGFGYDKDGRGAMEGIKGRVVQLHACMHAVVVLCLCSTLASVYTNIIVCMLE